MENKSSNKTFLWYFFFFYFRNCLYKSISFWLPCIFENCDFKKEIILFLEFDFLSIILRHIFVSHGENRCNRYCYVFFTGLRFLRHLIFIPKSFKSCIENTFMRCKYLQRTKIVPFEVRRSIEKNCNNDELY